MTDTLRTDAPADSLAAPPRTLWRQIEPTALGAGSILLLLIVWEALPHLVSMGPAPRCSSPRPRGCPPGR